MDRLLVEPGQIVARGPTLSSVGEPRSGLDALDGIGLRRDEIARLTGFSLRTVASWMAGNNPPAGTAYRRLIELEQLLQGLEKVIRREAIGLWLRKPNSRFVGMTPLQLIENGGVSRLWLMIHELGSGEPG